MILDNLPPDCQLPLDRKMTEKQLKIFYGLISRGKFDKALILSEKSAGDLEDSEQVIREILKIKLQLQKYLYLELI
jgi:hypothetical protein